MYRFIGIHVLIVYMFIQAYNKDIYYAYVYKIYVYIYTKFVDV